ncbi:hypothetical protein [Streptomyces sp. NPDC001070]
MDVAQLADFLAPFLGPLLDRAGTAVGDFGEAAWGQANRLWQRLAGDVAQRPAAQEAANDLAEQPDSAGARAALVWQLEKLLAADPGLREDLARIWDEGHAAGVTVTSIVASGERSVAVGRDVTGTISTGDAPRPSQS